MKGMRNLILLCLLVLSTAGFAQKTESVESMLSAGSENGKRVAVLMVHFGTTYDGTRALTIDAINEKVKGCYPGVEVREAYTSRIIIKRLKERGIVRQTPVEALMSLCSEGYTRVVVQSTNVICGIEYNMLLSEMRSMAPFFDDIRVGKPLLCDVEEVGKVADILTRRNVANGKKGEHVVFVGHGTETIDTAVYGMLDYMLAAKGCGNYHVGTIEGYPSFDDVANKLRQMKARSVLLVPMMFVAGDHAANDISVEWKGELEKEGLKVSVNMEGLGQIAEIQDMFVSHLRKAEKVNP